jgi:NAD(P)-dependent dehydrogenase (short-subunit alcohol dehydrogenase family)
MRRPFQQSNGGDMSGQAAQETGVLDQGAAGVRYDFSGSVVLVTGAARGMGRDIARRFAGAGASVVASDVADHVDALGYEVSEASDLDETVEGIRAAGAEAHGMRADVRDEEQVAALVEETVSHYGRLDILVNNAGVWTGAPVTELTEAQWDAAVDVNLKGPFLCSKHAARHMTSREGGGRILTVSSTSSLVGIPNQASYQASKHGVVGLTRTLALELAPHGITVNTICPTVVYTPMLDHLMTLGQAYFQDVGRLCGSSTVFPGLDALDVRDVSEAVLWLASPAARYITGIALPVDGGFTCK